MANMKKRMEARIRPRERMAKNYNGTSSGKSYERAKTKSHFGGDRRTYSYTMHFPERRIGGDRRKSKDRRKTPRYKIPAD